MDTNINVTLFIFQRDDYLDTNTQSAGNYSQGNQSQLKQSSNLPSSQANQTQWNNFQPPFAQGNQWNQLCHGNTQQGNRTQWNQSAHPSNWNQNTWNNSQQPSLNNPNAGWVESNQWINPNQGRPTPSPPVSVNSSSASGPILTLLGAESSMSETSDDMVNL